MEFKGLDIIEKLTKTKQFMFKGKKFIIANISESDRDGNFDYVYTIKTVQGDTFTIIVNEEYGYEDIGFFHENTQCSYEDLTINDSVNDKLQ